MDRNKIEDVSYSIIVKSLSARRAWIEIVVGSTFQSRDCVALRKESVDRNLYYGDDLTFADVALRKESVDRNRRRKPQAIRYHRRSPQGERG